MSGKKQPEEMPVSIDSDIFMRNLLRELSGTLESVIGLDEAAGFISLVGQHVGDWMNEEYRHALSCDTLSYEQVKDVLVDLKKRINGDFYVESADSQKIVLRNRRCPFGDKVKDRPSLCMMTSNVFGTVTAENLGYAKVSLAETIADGHEGCYVIVHLQPTEAAEADDGREYFKS